MQENSLPSAHTASAEHEAGTLGVPASDIVEPNLSEDASGSAPPDEAASADSAAAPETEQKNQISPTAPNLAGAEAPASEAEWLAQIKLLNSRFTEQERLSTARERIIDRLHEENQQLKQGELLKLMMPVYRDLMRLYDDLQQTEADYRNREQISVDEAVQDWQFFATAVTDLLYRYGVDLLAVEPGMPFEPKSHRAAMVKKTPEPARDKTVARVLTAGFSSENRILRPAGIEVFRFEPPADTHIELQDSKPEGGNA